MDWVINSKYTEFSDVSLYYFYLRIKDLAKMIPLLYMVSHKNSF